MAMSILFDNRKSAYNEYAYVGSYAVLETLGIQNSVSGHCMQGTLDCPRDEVQIVFEPYVHKSPPVLVKIVGMPLQFKSRLGMV